MKNLQVLHVSDRIFVLLQYCLPKRAITVLAGKVANARWGRLTTCIIRWFIGRYGVDMQEAANPDIASYATFNDFFTRALREDARPAADAAFICPVDGAISQLGRINAGQIFQAKGHHYSTLALLAGDTSLSQHFSEGLFATIYLSPKDYHRIHMPCAGRLKRMVYVPGTLFSVNPATAAGVPGLFARNERVVCEFESDFGTWVMVLVGATIVGSMATAWHGLVNPPRSGVITDWQYTEQAIDLKQGDEMGRFLLGSTVVMLFPQDGIKFPAAWQAGKPVRLGEAMDRR